MKTKQRVKIAVDAAMTVGLLFSMGYQFWGDLAHEWVGLGMFLLFLLHHGLNWNWWKRLFQGKYPPLRVLTVAIDLLVLCAMVGLMVSGIMLSHHVFAFLPISGGAAFARLLHMLSAYWGFVLMSAHLGLHWGMFLGLGRKAAKLQGTSKSRTVMLNFLGGAVALYGLFSFIERDLPTYLFLRTQFVFLDFEEPKLHFYADYLAIVCLFVFVTHWVVKLLHAKKERGVSL